MTISTSLTIEVGNAGALYDFTNRVRGLRVQQDCDIGTFGSGQAFIELDNNDGALTPTPGGSTYQQLNWFSFGVFISGTVTSGTGSSGFELFHGIVNDFELVDNGVNSIVLLGAVDAFSIGGRNRVTAVDIEGTTNIFITEEDAIEAVYNGYTTGGVTYIEQVKFPYLGGLTYPNVNIYSTGSVASNVAIILENINDAAAADVVNNGIMATAPSVGYPTTIELNAASAQIRGYIVNRDLTKDAYSGGTDLTEQRTFYFNETPTGAELPIAYMRRGYTIGDLINSAQIASTVTGVTAQESTNEDSIQQFGVRNTSFQSFSTTDARALETATLLTTRFSEIRFEPNEMSVRASQLADLPDALEDVWENLLDVRTGQWNPVVIEYTPTGASTPIVSNCVIRSRIVEATPADVTLTMQLVPAADYQSFVLDSDVLGVLDQNRLG